MNFLEDKYNQQIPGYTLVSNFGTNDKNEEEIIRWGVDKFKVSKEEFIVLKDINFSKFALYISNQNKKVVENWISDIHHKLKNFLEMMDFMENE